MSTEYVCQLLILKRHYTRKRFLLFLMWFPLATFYPRNYMLMKNVTVMLQHRKTQCVLHLLHVSYHPQGIWNRFLPASVMPSIKLAMAWLWAWLWNLCVRNYFGMSVTGNGTFGIRIAHCEKGMYCHFSCFEWTFLTLTDLPYTRGWPWVH